MKAIRIFLLVVIIIGLALIFAQSLWVPSVVDWIIHNEELAKTIPNTSEL